MSDDYYTATEAMRILGVSASRFYHLVQQGEIARISLPGDARHFVYRKEDIERIAEALSQVRAEPTTSIEQLVLKAYEHAELAYSRTTGITLYLTLALEALPADSPQVTTIKALIEQAGEASKMLHTLQLDVAGLADQK
jgi:Helix-turn-helix domain